MMKGETRAVEMVETWAEATAGESVWELGVDLVEEREEGVVVMLAEVWAEMSDVQI